MTSSSSNSTFQAELAVIGLLSWAISKGLLRNHTNSTRNTVAFASFLLSMGAGAAAIYGDTEDSRALSQICGALCLAFAGPFTAVTAEAGDRAIRNGCSTLGGYLPLTRVRNPTTTRLELREM